MKGNLQLQGARSVCGSESWLLYYLCVVSNVVTEMIQLIVYAVHISPVLKAYPCRLGRILCWSVCVSVLSDSLFGVYISCLLVCSASPHIHRTTSWVSQPYSVCDTCLYSALFFSFFLTQVPSDPQCLETLFNVCCCCWCVLSSGRGLLLSSRSENCCVLRIKTKEDAKARGYTAAPWL